jgi:parvulin-like peptidyl-prolyl isomerase
MIRLKGDTIQVHEVLSYLKQTLQLRQICHHILQHRIINQIANKIGIHVTIEELQAEVARVRYENRLFHPTDIFAWLNDHVMTVEDWENGIRDRLLAQKLSHHLFSEAAEQFFIEHRAEFDQVSLYQIIVPYEQLAREISYEIEEGELSFYEAAHVYDLDSQRRSWCGYEGKIYRRSMKPELSEIVFRAIPGRVIGPLTFDGASHLLMVEELIPAELTPDCYEEILDRLFQEWMTAELNYLLNP